MEIIDKIKTNWKPGLTVAMINIPLSISLAVASGATPLQGIITWIWAWIIASIFASSHYNVFWVAGALSSILMGFVLLHPENWVFLLPLIAIFSWFFILLVYIFKFTKYITLIPSTALHWFLISVWITIALSQLPWALGLNDPSLRIEQHKEVFMNLVEVYKNFIHINWAAFITFALGLGFLMTLKKYAPKFPAVIVLTIIWVWVWFLVSKGFLPDMLLLVDKYPSLAFGLWDFSYFSNIKIDSFAHFYDIVKSLFAISLVVAIIAIIETIISAKIAEKITKVKFDKDKEVFGLAMSNIGTWIVWGLPNTAVFIRTALNINAGRTHKISSFLIALFTLIIAALLFNGAFKYLAFPIISSILINIAIGLIDINLLKKLYHLEKQALFITLVTTFFSVFWEPTYGILIWTVITLLIYVRKITKSDANISIFRKWENVKKMTLLSYLENQNKDDVLLIKFHWGLNYLNIELNSNAIEKLNHNQKVIISLAHISNIDIDGMETIDEMIDSLENNWIEVYISWVEDVQKDYIFKLHSFAKLKEKWRIFNSSTSVLDKLMGR